VLLLFQPVIGGVPHYVTQLAEGLAEQGWEVSVAAPRETPVISKLTGLARRVVAFETPARLSPLDDLRVVRQLAALCRRDRVDLIHAHSSKAGAVAAVVGRIAGVPTVYSPHGWSFQRELPAAAERGYVIAERILARRHRRVIAVADIERADAERCGVVAPDQVKLIHTGIKDSVHPARELARRRLGIDQEAFVIGWVGRAGAQKRSDHLPTLARELADDAKLAVLGYYLPQTGVGLELTELGAVVTDSVTPETVYAAADALAVTSRWEGFPLVVLEAMRAGLPVVGYDIGGLREQVEDGVSGHLVEPGDPYALAGVLKQLCRDRELARKMGSAGRARLLSRFRFHEMVGKIERVYHQVIGSVESAPVEAAADAPAGAVSGSCSTG
jgi:glycosyltransferase involved in cell wall biosynthesis